MSLSALAYRTLMTGAMAFLPRYLKARAKQGKEDSTRLDERYGLSLPTLPADKDIIWLHAVSVGEANAALALAHAFAKCDDTLHMVITTNTATAAQLIADVISDQPITHIYTPFDAPRIVKRFFDHLNPIFGVILESDFWPCLIMEAHSRQIPLYLASAQMSEGSAKHWHTMRGFAAQIFPPFRHGFMTDERQKSRFQSLGLTSLSVTGTLKLPASSPRKTKADTAVLQALEAAANGRPILLAASTHEGEEQLALSLAQRLAITGMPHFLILAPRHPERGAALSSRYPEMKRISQGALPTQTDDAFIIDQLGMMGRLYQLCDIAFLGASFSGKGGHNPLEGAANGALMICGPSQFSNQFEFDQLAELGCCLTISDVQEMVGVITDLYADEALCEARRKAGIAYARKAQKRPYEVARQILSWHEGEA